jgi:hypothetical protein
VELTLAGERIDTKLLLSLREGTVYYFAHHTLSSPEPHYFIVINSDPLAQKVLLLAVVTSQVEKVKLRRKACLETVVELSPAVCDVFKKPSIVDCNDLKEVPLAEFNVRFVRKKIRYFDKDLPAHLRKSLRKAIHASAVLSDEQKALVGKP